ncbi:hypothetical protein AVEN_174458-1, partial [Araneus ventricosus]
FIYFPSINNEAKAILEIVKANGSLGVLDMKEREVKEFIENDNTELTNEEFNDLVSLADSESSNNIEDKVIV